MDFSVGDVVYIWPRIPVTVESVSEKGIGVVWFDHKNQLHRKTIKDTHKILGKQ